MMDNAGNCKIIASLHLSMGFQCVLSVIDPVLAVPERDFQRVHEVLIEIPDDLIDLQLIHGALIIGVLQNAGVEILEISPLLLGHVVILLIDRCKTVFPFIALTHLLASFNSTKRSCNVSTAASYPSFRIALTEDSFFPDT